MWYGVPELWFDISNHTTFCVTPSFLTIAHQHLAQHTIPLCNTIFQIAPYQPHYVSHHVSHSAPHFTSLLTNCDITPHSMTVLGSRHVLATSDWDHA